VEGDEVALPPPRPDFLDNRSGNTEIRGQESRDTIPITARSRVPLTPGDATSRREGSGTPRAEQRRQDHREAGGSLAEAVSMSLDSQA